MATLAAGAANAQSRVTLHGIADAGVEYTNDAAPTATGIGGGSAYPRCRAISPAPAGGCAAWKTSAAA